MVGFVKVIKCSFKDDCWYYDQINNTFFVWGSLGLSDEWLIVYYPGMILGQKEDTLDEYAYDIPLLIHKSDVKHA